MLTNEELFYNLQNEETGHYVKAFNSKTKSLTFAANFPKVYTFDQAVRARNAIKKANPEVKISIVQEA